MKQNISNKATETETYGKHNLFNIVNRVKWDLSPFISSLFIYIYFYIPMEQQTFFGMILKCLPIITLQYFTYKNRFNITRHGHSSYQQKILFGLIFGCIGDAFLDFPGYFIHGTIAFAISQLFNIFAFGFKPLNLKLGLKIFGIMSAPLIVVLPKLMEEEKLLLIVISFYTLLLKGMIWRAVARVDFNINNIDWPKIFGAVGAISFGLSDTSLALNKYWTNLPYAQGIIMTTYYMAQFGIALSVLSFTNENTRKSNKNTK